MTPPRHTRRTRPVRISGRRPIAGLAVGCVLALLAAACSIPFDTEPRAVSTTTSTTTTEPGAPSGSATAEIFLVYEDRLLVASRNLADTSPANIMKALLTGPTKAELAESIRSSIPTASSFLTARTNDGLLELTLGGDFFTAVRGSEFARATAQVVFSVSSSPGVDRVRLLNESGEPMSIPTSDGDKDAVTECDFIAQLATGDQVDGVTDRADLQRLETRRAELEARCG